jgi:hypothetical protein
VHELHNYSELKMATSFDLVALALNRNDGDIAKVRGLLADAVEIVDQSVAYKKLCSVSCAANLLALSRQEGQQPSLGTTTHAFHIAGGNIDLFSHGFGRLRHAHLTTCCDELINQWHSRTKQLRKCWSSFSYSLLEGDADTFPEHSRKFHVCASRDLAARQGVPQEQFPDTAFVVSELIKIVNLTFMGSLRVADVHVFAQTSANCVFTNHLDLHVHTQLALNVVLGVRDLATDTFINYPLQQGGMMIDTLLCPDPRTHLPFEIRHGISLPLRRTGDAALFRGSMHVHRTLSPPDGFVVYKLVIFLQ